MPENTLALCTDGIDNDQNGDTDLADPSCDAFVPRLTVNFVFPNDSGGTGIQFEVLAFGGAGGNVPGAFGGFFNSVAAYGGFSSRVFRLNPGDYGMHIVTGPQPQQYATTLSSDCNSTIAVGESKTCNIVIDDVSPTLTVVKHVNNGNGGTAVANQFTMDVTGNNVSTPSFVGSESGTPVILNAGSFNVTESSLPGYTELLGSNCSGSLSLGQNQTCTIVSDDIPPSLILINNLVNDNGGTATTTDWTLSASGPTSISGAGIVTSESTNGFTAGTYSLSEAGPAGYTASQWSCIGDVTNTGNSITLGIGLNATCTITNTQH